MRRARTLLVLAALVVAGACGADDGGPRGDAAPVAAQTLRVAAASSLTEAFGELADRFEAGQPEGAVTVELTFAGSSALVTQLEQGAPFDVLATADEASMASATAKGLVGRPAAIARNRLTIAVEPGNPLGIRTLADLGRPDVLTVLCAPAVPCGRLAVEALRAAGVDVAARSLEENVKGVVSKLALGEADAGLVYATDVRAAAGKVDAVDLADAPVTSLVSAVTEDAAVPDLAAAWLDWVRSADGRAVLLAHGFLAP